MCKDSRYNHNTSFEDDHPVTEYLWKPKITVKCKHSLYHLTYSEIYNTSANTSNNTSNNITTKNVNNELAYHSGLKRIKDFNIMLFIDIPTIDYYNDELHDIKLSKFNKRFKLNKLKHSIWKSFTNNDPEFWHKLIQSHKLSHSAFTCTLSIHSSGSLRYVETIKFLIESIYEMLKSYTDDLINLIIKINVSNVSLKWFKIFLSKSLLSIIQFNEISNQINNNNKSNIDSPFKEYFNKLNAKFSYHKNKCISDTLETIIVITNSTGIKALLTILADKPLTNFIEQSSIDELYTNSLTKSNIDPSSNSNKDNNSKDISESCTNEFSNSGGPLRRESSSLLNFQNSLLTSNKDKSIRIRSLSINRRTNKFLETQSTSKIPCKTQIISTHKEPFNVISRTKDILQLIDLEDKKQLEREQETDGDDEEEEEKKHKDNSHMLSHFQKNVNEHAVTFADTTTDDDFVDSDDDDNSDDDDDESASNEEEDGEEEDEDDEDDNDEGISFYVPSLLSRSGSSSDFNSMSPSPIPKKGRFRSLSLMDPAQRQPFNLDTMVTANDNETTNLYTTKSNTESTDSTNNSKTTSFTNIYIHDGNFNDTHNHTNKTYKRKNISIFEPNNNDNNNILPVNTGNNNNNNNKGLIPPEFYSRISTPSPSKNNSGTSLNSNYLVSYDSPHEGTLSPPFHKTPLSQLNLFEKNLVNKSFELNRDSNKSVENIFDRLINKKNEERNKHLTLMNFNGHNNSNNASPHHSILKALDEEDVMLGSMQRDQSDVDISQQPPSGIPYKIHSNSADTSTANLLFHNDETDIDRNSHSTMTSSKGSTLTRMDLDLYDHDRDGNDEHETQLPKPKPTAFKRIASLDLYGSNDDDNDDSSSNMWVLGRNR